MVQNTESEHGIQTMSRKQDTLTALDKIGQEIFERGSVGVFTIDASGQVLRANPRMLKLLGSPDETTSKLFNVFRLPTIPEDLKNQFRTMLEEGVPVEFDTDYTSMHGKKSAILVSGLPVKDEGGEVLGAVCQVFDISRATEAENQLRRTAKMESLMLLANSLAHDLNNVFTSLLGYSTLLQEEEVLPPAKSQRALGMVKRAAQSGANLVEQMLRFTSERRAKASSCLFQAAFEQTCSLFSHSLPGRIRLESESPESEADEVEVRGNQTRIEQIILNLAINSSEAIGENPGRIALSWRKVAVPPPTAIPKVTAHPAGFVALSVTDDGCGISEENQDKIFDPYFSTKTGGRGSGLGLSSVWGKLKELGGAIEVESTLGESSCFTVYLPMAGTEEAPASERAPVVRSAIGKGQRVLVVEADEAVNELLVWVLLKNGYKAVAARNLEKARKVLESGSPRVDAIAMDQELATAFQEDPGTAGQSSNWPTLCFAATASVRPKCRCANVLSKPFTPEEFLEALAELLDA